MKKILFDFITLQDVFEHIYDAEKAFSVIARTLKLRGAHFWRCTND